MGGAGDRSVRRWVALGLVVGLLAALLVAVLDDEDTGDAGPFDYLTAKAAELGNDPARIRAFVRDDVVPDDSYDGALRGAVGTLWNGAGSDLDRALLLHGLLDRAGVQTAPPTGRHHTVTVTIRTTVEGGTIEERARWRTADLAGRDLVLHHRRTGQRLVAVLEGPGRTLVSDVDARRASRQELVLRTAGPGASPTRRVRELFSRQDDDYPVWLDPENRHAVVVTTGFVPDWVRAKEIELARAYPEGADGLNHVAAYTFLAESDANTRAGMEADDVAASFNSPRLTIASSEIVVDAGEEQVWSLSLDLRKNDIWTPGSAEDRFAFNIGRSLYDSSLESKVLGPLTGLEAVSAVDALADAATAREAQLQHRLAVLARALDRLAGEDGRDDAALEVWPEGRPGLRVTFTRRGGSLDVAITDDLREALQAAPDDARWLLDAPPVDAAGAAEAAIETEVGLASAGGLDVGWRPQYRHVERRPRDFWDETSAFTYDESGTLVFQEVLRLTDEGLEAEVTDYYDNADGSFFTQPVTATVVTSPDALESADVYTTWSSGGADQQTDRTREVLSRRAYRQLRDDGETVLRYRNEDGSDTPPIRFVVVDRDTQPVVLDGRDVEVPVLVVTGSYEADDLPDPEEQEDWPAIPDPATGAPINHFRVLDDERLPLFLFGSVYQSGVTGSVADAVSGAPVPDAVVEVSGHGEATTWPDGSFALPASEERLGPTTVSVTAPDHEALEEDADLAQADSLPLTLELDPVPDEHDTVWFDHRSDPAALDPLDLAPRSLAVIRETVARDHAVAVVIPGHEVTHPYGTTDAWMELHVDTGELFGVLGDGLHGATSRPLTTTALATLRDLVSRGGAAGRNLITNWLNQQIDKPFDPALVPFFPVAYMGGRIAAWYLFSAGALEAVGANIDDPSMSLCAFHKRAVEAAYRLAKYGWQVGATTFAFGVVVSQIGGASVPYLSNQFTQQGFKLGVAEGLAVLEQVYAVGWGLSQTAGIGEHPPCWDDVVDAAPPP